MRLAVVCVSMLASASVVACLLLFNVSGGSDSLSASAGALAGVSSVTHADRLAGLRGVCLLAVSRALKTQVIGCSWIARSVSVVACGRGVFVGVFVGSVASTGPVCITNAY